MVTQVHSIESVHRQKYFPRAQETLEWWQRWLTLGRQSSTVASPPSVLLRFSLSQSHRPSSHSLRCPSPFLFFFIKPEYGHCLALPCSVTYWVTNKLTTVLYTWLLRLLQTNIANLSEVVDVGANIEVRAELSIAMVVAQWQLRDYQHLDGRIVTVWQKIVNVWPQLVVPCFFHISHFGFVMKQVKNTKNKVRKTSRLSMTIN